MSKRVNNRKGKKFGHRPDLGSMGKGTSHHNEAALTPSEATLIPSARELALMQQHLTGKNNARGR